MIEKLKYGGAKAVLFVGDRAGTIWRFLVLMVCLFGAIANIIEWNAERCWLDLAFGIYFAAYFIWRLEYTES